MKLLHDRPWIWVVIAHVVVVAVLTTMVVISKKYGIAEVPVAVQPNGH